MLQAPLLGSLLWVLPSRFSALWAVLRAHEFGRVPSPFRRSGLRCSRVQGIAGVAGDGVLRRLAFDGACELGVEQSGTAIVYHGRVSFERMTT